MTYNKNFYLIKFGKTIKEDFLVDIINNILKNLYNRNYSFYLDDVLIGKRYYYFVFGGNPKFSILVNEISDFLRIKSHKIIN